MSIRPAATNEKYLLVDRGNRYSHLIVPTIGLEPEFDLEKLIGVRGRVYTLEFPYYQLVNAHLREEKPLLSFGSVPVFGQGMLLHPDSWTPLDGEVYFVGRTKGDPLYTAKYWKGENGSLKEKVSKTYDALISRLHAVVVKLDEGKIILADIGTNQLKLSQV